MHLVPDQAGSSTEGWLENPCNYVSVGLVGTVSLRDGELSYSGTIENPSCGAFLVTLPASGSAHGHLSCPEGDTDWLLGPTQCYVSRECSNGRLGCGCGCSDVDRCCEQTPKP